jgi:methionyl-tRNA formyltransferase
MRIGWIGFHVEGIAALRGLLETKAGVAAVITLEPEVAAKRSGAADYDALCHEFGVPLHKVRNINEPEALELLRELALDIVFVIGWTQIVHPKVLKLAKLGMIGAHASLLPRNRGRAPINWAIINGEKITGNSLIWLAAGVDTGDIIDQTQFSITPYDTCASLYEKVAQSNREMILRALPSLMNGKRPGKAQPETIEPALPGRRPDDGLLDWSMSNARLYDFVRGLTRPYPGAFSWLSGTRWRIWNCALLPQNHFSATSPGLVLGPLVSAVDAACGQVVACGDGAVALLELENDEGKVMKGRELSELPWDGQMWTNG